MLYASGCLTVSREAGTAADIAVGEIDEWISAYALQHRTDRNNFGNALRQVQAKIKE